MFAEYLPQILLALSIQTVGVLSPGPGVMLILGVATARGRAPALMTAFGISCGSIILAGSVVLGIAVLFAEIAYAMTAMRIVGGLYLFWLGWKAFSKAVNPPPLELHAVAGKSAARTALAGFLLQVTNPKAIAFWLAIAAVGGVGHAPWPVIALFVLLAWINSFVGHSAYALLLSAAPVRSLLVRFRSWVEGALGAFFVFAGYKLLTSVQR
ncbi:LysE family translocator [Pseudohoeflea suaedae]|uniref:LysE family translocator n=2 Tax=Pseudohoeflea suaedae TaxID=877384 RepID=A0A4R5PM48_9HYPH|nr:LysE family translocator [Pseudohoeflea suaedae]